MGKLVDLSSVPMVRRTSQYDADIDQALAMPNDKALQVDIPTGDNAPKVDSINIGLRARIKQRKVALTVHRAGNNVYLVKEKKKK